MTKETYSVGEVARIAHVTARTIHHYDEIGLLVPSHRTEAGYRVYGNAELERLHDILLHRALGLPLEEIRIVVDAAPADRLDTLIEHRRRLERTLERTREIILTLDRRIEDLKGDRTMEELSLSDGFDAFDQAEYREEVRERWGDTEAYRHSEERTKRYSPEQWARLKREIEDIEARWGQLLREGHEASDPVVVEVAERARLHIDRWFYPCSHTMHVSLADMYVSDPRFQEHYEARAKGLAQFVSDSIRANMARAS